MKTYNIRNWKRGKDILKIVKEYVNYTAILRKSMIF